jgi:ketosteroid isomerase-like protein
MPGQLQTVVEEFFAALDELDVDRLIPMFAEGVEEIDEVSRQWLRSKSEVMPHFTEFVKSATSVKSVISNVRERTWGDVGVVTCWLDQAYTFDGKDASISAPTTILLERQKGEWRFALFHSYPLPEA